MAQDSWWWRLLPRHLRRLPADLAAIVVAVLLTFGFVYLPVVNETPLRVAFGLAFLLFVPGYAIVAAVWPQASRENHNSADEGRAGADELDESGIDGIERVALSFGMSIALSPLVGFALNFTPFGIRLTPIVFAIGSFSLLATAIAAHRRWQLPPEERFRVAYEPVLDDVRTSLFDPETRYDTVLNLLLAIALLVAVASVGYTVAVPDRGDRYTEFYLLTEDEDGELISDGYPTEFVQGEPQSLVVGVTNQEHERVNYTAIVAIQRVEFQNNSSRVLESTRLDRWDIQLSNNETWQLQHTVAPPMTGSELRLTYFLYRGEPPETLTTETAYRELHIWVNVSSP